MASFAHHSAGIDLRRLPVQGARLGAVADLAPVENRVADGNLAVIDVVLLPVLELAVMRAGVVDFLLAWAQTPCPENSPRRLRLDPACQLPRAGDIGGDLRAALGAGKAEAVRHLAGAGRHLLDSWIQKNGLAQIVGQHHPVERDRHRPVLGKGRGAVFRDPLLLQDGGRGRAFGGHVFSCLAFGCLAFGCLALGCIVRRGPTSVIAGKFQGSAPVATNGQG